MFSFYHSFLFSKLSLSFLSQSLYVSCPSQSAPHYTHHGRSTCSVKMCSIISVANIPCCARWMVRYYLSLINILVPSLCPWEHGTWSCFHEMHSQVLLVNIGRHIVNIVAASTLSAIVTFSPSDTAKRRRRNKGNQTRSLQGRRR